MSDDDPSSSIPTAASKYDSDNEPPAKSKQARSIFRVPAPLKRVFDKFPLVSYEENALPLRAPLKGDAHKLYVFTTDEDARNAKPSFNPACLKWQVRSERHFLY